MPIPSFAVRCCVLLLALSLHACGKVSEARQTTPQGAVDGFYNWRINSGTTGAPDERQLAEMVPYITEELRELLNDARPKLDGSKKSKAASQGRNRPFAEGDLFSSLFDGPTSFKLEEEEVRSYNDVHLMPVKLTSAKQLPYVTWVDTVTVVNEDGHYVVADIEYGSHWEFGANTTLVGELKRAAKRKTKR